MPESSPRIEVLTGPGRLGEYEPRAQVPAARPGRLRIFLMVFIVCSLLGLIYTFARPPVYRSTAMLLIVPPATTQASTERTAYTEGISESNVTVHSRSLASPPLLAKLFERVQPLTGLDSLPTLQQMLSVVPVEGADIVELRAEGAEPGLLPLLVENWIGVYLEAYEASKALSSNSANATLREQLDSLDEKIALKRGELEAFREQHDIVSLEREENRVASRLKALNRSLDKALEDQATAEGELAAIQDAIERGQPVGLPQDQRRITQLEQRALDLRERLNDYAERFTPEYMALDPNIQALQQDLTKVQDRIRAYRAEAAQTSVAEAERAVYSSRQRVTTLRQELDAYKQTAAEFSKRFAEHEALREELTQLEILQRETAERLVKLEVGRSDLLPQIKVLEQPYLPSAPVRPHYLRDAAISVGGAFILALLAIWIYEFLTRSPQEGGRRLWPVVYAFSDRRETQPAVAHAGQEALGGDQPVALSHSRERELSEAEVTTLIDVADAPGKQLLFMLLSGLSLPEIAALRWQDVDFQANTIQVGGARPRAVPLPQPLRALWLQEPGQEGTANDSVWQTTAGQSPSGPDTFSALTTDLAHDAGLAYGHEVTPQALRHTYLAYLARQGLRGGDLVNVAGDIPADSMALYRQLAPPGPGKSLDQVDRLYPALRGRTPGP